MALTKYVRVTMLCLVAALALSSCAKKNNSLAARLNAAGAKDINPGQSQAAEDQAKAMNYDVEFMNINVPVQSGNSLSVVSRIRVNQNLYDVTTLHNTYGPTSQPATANQVIGNANFSVNAVCGNQYCNPYYLIINVTAGNTQIIQQAQMKFFSSETNLPYQNDVFYSRKGGEFLSVPQAIDYLNLGAQQAAASESYE